MWLTRHRNGKATGGALRVLLLILSTAGCIFTIILLVGRVKALTAEVDRLEIELAEAKMRVAETRYKHEFEAALNRNQPKTPPKPEWSPAEGEAINALALLRAVCDVASEKRFFTGYDVLELHCMIMQIESDLRKIIQQRPPFNEPTSYWRLGEDEQFKKSRSTYEERIMKSIREHSLD